jgi:hypothetical protein
MTTATPDCDARSPLTGQQCQRHHGHLGWHSFTSSFPRATHMVEWTDDGQVRTTVGPR